MTSLEMFTIICLTVIVVLCSKIISLKSKYSRENKHLNETISKLKIVRDNQTIANNKLVNLCERATAAGNKAYDTIDLIKQAIPELKTVFIHHTMSRREWESEGGKYGALPRLGNLLPVEAVQFVAKEVPGPDEMPEMDRLMNVQATVTYVINADITKAESLYKIIYEDKYQKKNEKRSN